MSGLLCQMNTKNADSAPSSAQFVQPLLVIGGGTMATAIIDGALAAGVLVTPPIVVEPDADRRSHHQRGVADLATGVAELHNAEQSSETGCVVLAVKPQIFPDVCDEHRRLGSALDARCVLSVMAGVRSGTICARFTSSGRVVRVMPNTPASIGQGMTAIAAGVTALPEDLRLAEVLMSSIGRVLRIDEAQMDVFTGLAGSGPAYVFRFAEALIEAGRRNGLSDSDATTAAIQTITGASALLADTYASNTGTAASLRRAVTSPGGTTAAGLAVLDNADIDELLTATVRAAAQRGAQLAEH